MPQYLSIDPNAGSPYGQYSNDFTPRNPDGSPVTAIDRNVLETAGNRGTTQPTNDTFSNPNQMPGPVSYGGSGAIGTVAGQPPQSSGAIGAVAGQIPNPAPLYNASGPTVSVTAPTGSNGMQTQIPGYPNAATGQSGGGTQPSITGTTTDPAQITAWLQWQAQQPGADPILQTPDGINYYLGKIQQTGGLNPSNTGYWQNKSTLAANGGAVGAPEGGGTIGGFGNYTLPTGNDVLNMPGYQFAYDQGQKAVQTSAASKGNLLSGGTLKALDQFGTGTALQGYGQLANLGMQANALNFGQNSTIAGLGYNATNSSYS